MPKVATSARAEKRLLGTLFVLLAALAAAFALPRAAGQEAKPKAKEPADSSPSDKPPATGNSARPLPVGAIRRLGSQPGEMVDSTGHTGAVNSLAFSADGKLLASWGADETGPQLRVWEVSTGKLLQKLDGRGDIAFTPDGKQLVSRSSPDANEDEVLVWEVATGKVGVRIPLKQLKFVQMLPDGKQCVIIYGSEAAYIDLDTGKIARVVPARWGTPLALSREGDRLATVRRGAGGDSRTGETKVYLAEVSTARDDLGVMEGKQGRLLGADFSPAPLARENRANEERLFAAGGWDNSIHVWDVRPRQQIDWILRGHTDRVVRVAFSPDSRFLVSTSMDETIRIWDLAIPKPGGEAATISEVVLLRGHVGYATPVAFSPDGRILATGGSYRDQTIVLWDFWKLVLGDGEPLTAPSDERLQSLWNDLASDAAGGGPLAAVGTLATAPGDAIRLVRRQLEPYVSEAQRDRILELIAQLGNDRYAVREAATEALIRLRRQAEGLLRAALAETQSAEVRFRLRRILSRGNAAPTLSAAEVRRYRRVVLLLERLGSPEARKLLEQLAEVFPAPAVSRDARGALARLTGS